MTNFHRQVASFAVVAGTAIVASFWTASEPELARSAPATGADAAAIPGETDQGKARALLEGDFDKEKKAATAEELPPQF